MNILKFSKLEIELGKIDSVNVLPSMSKDSNIQNQNKSNLDEYQRIYFNYGVLENCFPYSQIDKYTRDTTKQFVDSIILENDFLLATFLPGYGGRLWSLIDKKTGKNLLYTNNVIRASNLAVRNAWFSGGVEFNIGIIGHHPFTFDQVNVATYQKDGVNYLRFYEYEKIRGVVYQIDIWLESIYLNVRVKITNPNNCIVPMYWWSNIAVEEHENGRIVVPTNSAFTSDNNSKIVEKVKVPEVNGVDITRYNSIPYAVDYFFDIGENDPKYISNLDKNGYGLIHFSTSMLQGRKLFSWGHQESSDTWQKFLTNNNGDYIEIQAGLPKTQYGCIPMPSKSVYEWIECYGAIQVEDYSIDDSFEKLKTDITSKIKDEVSILEKTLVNTRDLSKTIFNKKITGSNFSGAEQYIRELSGDEFLPTYLDFDKSGILYKFLEKGSFNGIKISDFNNLYISSKLWTDKLNKHVSTDKTGTCLLLLSLVEYNNNNFESALRLILESSDLNSTYITHYIIANIEFKLGLHKQCEQSIRKAFQYNDDDISLYKSLFKLLIDLEHYSVFLELYDKCIEQVKSEGRLIMYRAFSLLKLDMTEEVDDIIRNNILTVDDIREGETYLDELWKLYVDKKGSSLKIPKYYNFNMKSGE